jgi:hypothetical protein
MKKIIILFILVLFLASPFFVFAQTQTEAEQQLTKVLIELIAKLQQQIADILARRAPSITTTTPPVSAPATADKPACTPNWVCGAWSQCVDNSQKRSCSDSKKCGVFTGIPDMSYACGFSPSIPLSVSLDILTPEVQNLTPGQKNVTLAKIKLTNYVNTSITNINSIQVGSSSEIAFSKIENIKIYDGSAQVGSTATSLANNGSFYYAWINASTISLFPHTSKILTLVADVKSDSPSNSTINLGVSGLRFNAPGCPITGTPAYGKNFMIVPSATVLPLIKITSPNGGEQCAQGSSCSIAWQSAGLGNGNVSIILHDFSTSGDKQYTIALPSTAVNSYSWTIPATGSIPRGAQYKIEVKIITADSKYISDFSDNYFSVVAQK